MNKLLSNDILVVLDGVTKEISDPAENQFLEAYKHSALDFAMPKFLPFDPGDSSQRFADQIIKAFPFTSESWPWPANASGGYLQPLVQLSLERASKALRVNLGDGLLQIWIDKFEPIIRLIPSDALDEPLDNFYPDDAPWLINEEEDEDKCLERVIWQFKQDLPSPIVKWMPAGEMFPKPSLIYCDWVEETLKLSNKSQKKLFEAIEALPIPIDLSDYFEKRVLIWLGGYPSSYTNEISSGSWPRSPEKETKKTLRRSLIHLASDDVFAIVVSYKEDEKGTIIFEVQLSN